MNTWNTRFALIALFTSWIAGTPLAQAGDWQFTADASAGASYDNNVGIEDLDTNAQEADSIVELSAGGSVSYTPTEQPFSLRVGYDYSGTSHSRFQDFDLDLHHAVAAIDYRHAGFDAALTFDQYVGVLDGANYVSISQVSPSIGRLFGESLYVRAAWLASTRDYDVLTERSANNSAGRIDTYLLFDGLDRYLSLSLQTIDEDARASEFDYEGFKTGVGYTHTFALSSMRLKLKSGLRFEDRTYAASAAEGTDEARTDQRWRATLGAEVPFSEHVSIHGMLEHTNNASSLESARLNKFSAGLELRVSF
ncbi:MAG: hypothetical protein KJO82_12755 [Gammaproteobacteria bacterium]|nr:hypothetical protein [Gammaproteobacteria bacterium]